MRLPRRYEYESDEMYRRRLARHIDREFNAQVAGIALVILLCWWCGQ